MILRLNAAECIQVLRDHCDNELLQHTVKITRSWFEPETNDDGGLTFLFEFEEERE